MENSAPVVANGLKNIISTKTNIAEVDGQNGKLTIRGYDISELSGNVEFEEVCYLLWHGELPNQTEYQDFKAEMARLRQLPPAVLQALEAVAPHATGMDILRIGASMLSVGDDELGALEAMPRGILELGLGAPAGSILLGTKEFIRTLPTFSSAKPYESGHHPKIIFFT